MVYFDYLDDSHYRRAVQHDAGVAVLKKLCITEYGFSFSDNDIVRDNYGKPVFFDSSKGFFNISHCEGLCCAVYSVNASCGIDCEKIRPFRESVIKRVFTETEQEYFSKLPENERDNAFFLFWTLKESYGKFTGRGIADMKNISFSFADNALVSDHPELSFSVYSDGEYFISVCTYKEYLNDSDMKILFGKRIY